MASERDIQDVINTLIAEGAGEGQEGMRRIAETILNRAEQRGISPAEVVRQRSQYTGYSAPGPAAVRAQSDPAAISAAQAAWNLAQGPDDPTMGANHYFNPNVVRPSWANAMTPTGQYGNHAFYTDRERVQPRQAPTPATPSIDMAQMRRISAPSQLIPDSFSRVSRPRRTLADEIGMSPIPGGQQQAPLFDAAYDERTGQMRLTREPIDSQGMAVGRSREPAPTPATMSPQVATRRATDPVLQAELNARYPARLPDLSPPSMGPTTRRVATTTIRPSISDMVRGNPMQTREQATTVASIPTRPRISASDMVRGRSGISTIATIPTTGFPTTEQIVGATGFRPPPAIPDRLTAGILPPALYGGVNTGPIPRPRPNFPTQTASRVAPVPFQRPTAVGTQLAVQPMPPMPIPRPPGGIGGPVGRPQYAPIPAQMGPITAMRRAMPVLRPPTSPSAQHVWMTGFSDSESSGGAHGGSENDKFKDGKFTRTGRRIR